MQNNYVKKYMDDFNKSSVQKDRKKELKNGYSKHKKSYKSERTVGLFN